MTGDLMEADLCQEIFLMELQVKQIHGGTYFVGFLLSSFIFCQDYEQFNFIRAATWVSLADR